MERISIFDMEGYNVDNQQYEEVKGPIMEPFVDTRNIINTYRKYREEKKRISLMNADIYYLEGWFSRISWKRKKVFVIKVLRTITELATLKIFISALKPLTKDLLYSNSKFAKFSVDILPKDDDRALDTSILAEVIEQDLTWLKSLNEKQRCHILLDLIAMGGSALAEKALEEAAIMNDIYEFIDYLEKMFLSDYKAQHFNFEKNKVKQENLLKTMSKEIARNTNISPLFDMHKACQVLSSDLSNWPIINELLKDVKNQERLWDYTLKNLLRTVSTGEVEGKNGKPRIDASALEVDKLQLLPVWVNRQMLKYLDNKSKKALSEVDEYWKRAVAEEAKENGVRTQLDRVIRKLETKLLSAKLPGKRVGSAMKKNKNKAGSAGGNKKHKRAKGVKKPATANLGNMNDARESIFTILKVKPKSRNPFRGAHHETRISAVYMYDRSVACSRRWLACSENTSVVFYNLISGKKTNFRIKGHSLAITCIAFFPQSFRIATGSLDKTIITWNIWNGKELATYTGHKGVILSVTVNEHYIASCSSDKAIIVFSQLTGIPVIEVNNKNWTPSMLILTIDNLIYWITLQGSLKMFSVTDENLDKNILTAHKGSVSYLMKIGDILLTTGTDLYVRLWNANLLNEKPLVEFYHEISVSSAALSNLTVITACDDGCLRFWDIVKGKLFKTITINMARIPIISMCVQHYNNHVKVICNNEADLLVLEFKLKWIKPSKTLNPYEGIMMHNQALNNRRNAQSRLYKMHNTRCTLSVIRFRKNYKTSQQCLLKKCVLGNALNEIFPRCSSIKSKSTTIS